MLKLQLHDAIYRLRFYSKSLIHILSRSNSHNKVASMQTNRGDKSHRVIIALFDDEKFVTDRLFISIGRSLLYCSLVASKDFSANVFTVGEKAKSYQTNNQTTEIKKVIHIILTFSLTSDSRVRKLLLVWEPV